MTTTHGRKGTATTESKQIRKGLFWDQHAGQYACRIGYKLDAQGRRIRDVVFRLGADENQAIVRHAKRCGEWEFIVQNWGRLSEAVRPGLSEDVREAADLAKPIWVKQEWVEPAEQSATSTLLNKITDDADRHVNTISASKRFLAGIAQSEHNWLKMVPDDIRARVLQVIQPAANELRGVAVDARRLTLRQAATEYLTYKKGKVGLKLQGRKSGGGINGSTYHHAEAMIEAALLLLN